MKPLEQIPTLSDLALQYGTISQEQHHTLNRLYQENQKADPDQDFEDLLMESKMATGYQIGLLKLIREYLIIQKNGEIFGKIAIEKGFASQADVDKAMEFQKKEFKRAKIKKLIGDILVESAVITIKQKNAILKEQEFIELQADEIFDAVEPGTGTGTNASKQKDENKLALSPYEEQFLKIKALDKEFCACLIEKKLASSRQIKIAQRIQDEEFEKKQHVRILGDIMVNLNILSEEQKNQILKEQQRLETKDKDLGKKPVLIRISQDRMEALSMIDPEKFDTVTLDDIKQALKDKGVRHGIYSDAILQCNLDMGNTTFTAARQDFSVELIKQKKTTYYFNTAGVDDEKKDKGATLAQQQFGNEIYLKKDLFGENIEQYDGYNGAFRCDAGVRLSNDKTKAFAGKTGFPSLSIEKKIFIHPAINVLEDADLRYGPLERYANLTISGVLTGAYPVTAGNLTAREIRGASITAVGNVTSQVGITDAHIVAQGDIHARYLHNCRIETFGNIYVENEIIDSQIFCSGKIYAPKCRIISSGIFGKKGVEIFGAGSSKTPPCIICAGTEHHLLERVRQINSLISDINRELQDLEDQLKEQDHFSKRTFQKMVELKIFHDRARAKKEKLSEQFKKNKNKYSKTKLKNIVTLINTLEKRKAASFVSLKELNHIKIKYDKKKENIKEKIKKIRPGIERRILTYKIDITSFFEWARKQENIPQIKINGNIFQGTLLKGTFSSVKTQKNMSRFAAFEKQSSNGHYQMVVDKIKVSQTD